jgi:polar amino acid transport system substrate-binding protein
VSTRFALACSVLAAIVLAATVSAPRSDHSVPVTVGPGPPTAVRLAAGRPPGQPPAASDCTPQNLLASLRPQGPLPAPGQMPAGSTMARIAKRGWLTVAVLTDVPPFASRDMNLQLEGFDIDIARDIAEAIFGNRELVVFQPLPEADRFETVRSGRVDLTIAAATITCPLREQVDFSTVYYEAGQRVLVNRADRNLAVNGLDGLGGKRVCAARGSTSLPNIQHAAAKPIPVDTATETDCLALLQLGEVDAVSTDDTILAGMVTQDPQTEVVGPRFTQEPYGVAINKNNPDLVRFVNAVLQRRVEDGQWRASYEHWLVPLRLPASLPTPQYRD